jgi:hypothetical protein
MDQQAFPLEEGEKLLLFKCPGTKSVFSNGPEAFPTLSTSRWREILTALIAENRPFRFQARGDSMGPFILHGDTVTVAPFTRQPPRVGEVVAYVHPESGRFLLHRVIGRKRDGCLIQGDNLRYPDGLIPKERLWGRIIQVERDSHPAFWGRGLAGRIIALLQRARLLRILVNGSPRGLVPLLKKL